MFSIDFLLGAGRWTAFLQGGGRSSVRDVDPSFGTFGGVYEAAGYTMWNAGASWSVLDRLQIVGRLTNLFDRDYEETLGYPALGRSAMVGLRVATSR
jgi:outer membrane receptor protein involved in Fe transport